MRYDMGGFARAGLCCTAALLAGLTSASATQVRFPKTSPKVALDVPDGWSVAYTDIGLELRAPTKDSVIMATIVKRSKDNVDAWRKKTLARLETDGVTVQASAKDGAAQAPKPADPPPPAPSASTDAKEIAKTSKDPSEVLPGNAAKPTFAFAGTPSLAAPNVTGQAAAFDFKQGVSADAVKKAPKGAPKVNGMAIQNIRLTGGMLNGKPTDIQLVLFSLPNDEVFLTEQQSAPDDNRAAAILMSTKPHK